MIDEAYTIYCSSRDWERVSSKIDETPGWNVVNRSQSRIVTNSFSGNLKISALLPGTDRRYGFVYAGTINKAKEIPDSDVFDKQSLVDKLKLTNMILGCVATPEFSSQDERFDMILALSTIFNGIIFDGFTFLSCDSEIIVSLDGSM